MHDNRDKTKSRDNCCSRYKINGLEGEPSIPL